MKTDANLDELMAAVASDSRCSIPISALESALGVIRGGLAPVIAEAVALGQLAAWVHPKSGSVVTLGVGVAAALRIAPDSRGKWVPVGAAPSRYESLRGGLRGRTTTGHGNLHSVPSRELDPADIAAIREEHDDSMPRAVVFGCRAWPTEGQSRAPAGPHPGEPPAGRALAVGAACEACGGLIEKAAYCAVCDRRPGSMVPKAKAAVTRATARKAAKAEALRGGRGNAA